MASKSFCLDQPDTDARNSAPVLENQPSTPGIYRASPKRQEKEFLQLYIKARAQASGSHTKQPRSLQHDSNLDKKYLSGQDENRTIEEAQSPNQAGSSLRKKAILRNIDMNSISKTFTPDKPSQFKLNHESGVPPKNQIEETKVSCFKPTDYNNDESLQDIEPKEVVHRNQYPTSIEILLPTQQEIQPENAGDLEDQIVHNHQVVTVNAGERQDPEYDPEYHREDQDQEQNQIHQENENRRSRTRRQAHELRNNQRIADRIVFGANVENTYKKIFAIYLIWFLSYAILLGFNFGVLPYFVVFLFAILVESYFIYELCKRDPRGEYDPIQEKARFNSCAQFVGLIILEVMGILKLVGLDFPLSLATIPIFLTTIFSCYLNNTSNRRGPHALTAVFQTLLSLQVLTLCLKVDGALGWSWQGVFWVSWAFLVVIAFYCLGLFMMFLFFLISEDSNISRGHQLTGLAWMLLALCGYIAALFFLLYGFTAKLETGTDSNWIYWSLLGGIGHTILLAGFTLLARNKIKRFLRNIIGHDIQLEQEKTPEVRFEKATEGLPSYIVRFTPSYFLTFDDSLKVKDRLKLRNIKKRVSLMKGIQYRRGHGSALLDKKSQLANPELDYLPLVKHDMSPEVNELPVKSLLARRLERNNKLQSSQVKQIVPVRLNHFDMQTPLDAKPQLKDYGTEAKKPEKIEEDFNAVDVKNEKLCFSANDVDFMKRMDAYNFLSEVKTPLQVTRRADSEKDEVKACIICFDKYPDAVVMGCGHGGICYQCALESWKKSQECFMCRGKIDKVLHIDTHKIGKFDMRKVLSATKLVKNEPRDYAYGFTENFADTMYATRNHI